MIDLDRRAKTLLKTLVERYNADGQPVGSRTLSRASGLDLSPATIRNVMADLEDAGLLYAPHTSAGRLPTEAGLRLYVDGLLELGHLTDTERQAIEGQCAVRGRSIEAVLVEHRLDLLSSSSAPGFETSRLLRL